MCQGLIVVYISSKKYYGNFLIMYAECYCNLSFTLQIVDRLKGLLDQVGVNYTQRYFRTDIGVTDLGQSPFETVSTGRITCFRWSYT